MRPRDGMRSSGSNTVKHERVDGAARIEFTADPKGTTVLTDLYQRAPCRVLFPIPEADEPLQAVLLTTSGGLTAGDRVQVNVVVGAEARATVTSQAAEKIYRAAVSGEETHVSMSCQVERDGYAEWLAQETILFNGSRLRRSFCADVAAGGRLLAVESMVFGRTAMSESFDAGLLHDSRRIHRDGRLVWADGSRLEGDVHAQRRAPFSFGTAVACSTVLYVGDDAVKRLDGARRLLAESSVRCGATVVNGVLVARLLSDRADELRSTVMRLVGGIRQSVARLPTRLPRVWYC